MTVEELLQQVRYAINDTQKVEYTDAELINYVNDALRFVSNELIRLSSPLMLKTTTLNFIDNSADLPSDFIREEAVIANGIVLNSIPATQEPGTLNYKILGNKIYSKNNQVLLLYYAGFPSVLALNQSVPIPDYMLSLVKSIVAFLALNRNEYNTSVEQELIKVFSGQVLELAKMIGEQFYERILPFTV